MKLTTSKFLGLRASFAFGLLVLLFSFASSISAQTIGDMPPTFPCGGEKAIGERTLDEVLCLENEQRRSIRLINQDMKPQLDAARRRVQFAQRALDEAIYGENTSDEKTIEQRANDLGAAQAEVARVRSLTDFRIRRVLTQDQVKRFRFWREWRVRQNAQKLNRVLQNNQPVNRRPINQNNPRVNQNNLRQQIKSQTNKKPY